MNRNDLTSFIGTEYTGLGHQDLLRQDVFEDVVDQLRLRDLVVIRGIELTPPQQIELAARLGTPVPFVMKEFRHPKYEQILVSSNETTNSRPLGIPRVGNFWHQDSSFTQTPAPYTMLHGVNVPRTTGHTLFAAAADVYQRLPQEWKAKLADRIGRHTITKQQRIAPQHVGLSIAEMKALVALEYPDVQHPVVRRDPDTDRLYLYAAREYMGSVIGLDANENAAFFDLLDELLSDPDRIYTHRWTPNDLLLWKTATTYHVATEVERGVARTVHRISIAAGSR